MTEELLEHFRLRINTAPNSFASFSTDSYLFNMGFDSSQYGKRKYTNDSFKMENKDLSSFWTVEANEKLLPELIVTSNKFKIFTEVFEVNFISEDYTMQITKKDSIRGNPWSLGRTSDSQMSNPGSIPARSK
jgi:hypothetical protein